MITSINTSQSKQNLGMSMVKSFNFDEKFAKAYAKKRRNIAVTMQDEFALVEKQQKNTPRVNLWVDFDEKNKLKFDVVDKREEIEINVDEVRGIEESLFDRLSDIAKLRIMSDSTAKYGKMMKKEGI